MKRRLGLVACSLLISLFAVSLFAKIGGIAPDFTGVDSNGQTHKLSDYRGKYVVLEWTGNYCPFTQKLYERTGALPALQKKWTDKGVIWLLISSDAPGTIGYVTPEQENAYLKKMHSEPTAAILDPTGAIGHLYHAKSTLEMFIIAPDGKFVYHGAIDDHPSIDPADVPKSKNYVDAALTEVTSGKAVSLASTQNYGCWIKYGEGKGEYGVF
jgi:peroxiredoxin